MNKLKITYIPVEALVANPKNARLHSPEQIQKLATSIRNFGFTNPVLIAGDNELVAGHGRLEAARVVGLDKIPTIDLSHLSADQRRAYAIADNKIPLEASWDYDLLKSELESLDLSGFDLALTAFSGAELDALLKSAEDMLPSVLPTAQPTQPANPLPTPGNADNDFEDFEDTEETPEDEGDYTTEGPEPKASDREYSNFELVMLHENKLLLVETLNNIRQQMSFEKIEDALVWMVRFYNSEKGKK